MNAARIRIAAGVVVAVFLVLLPLAVQPAAPRALPTGNGVGEVAAVGRSVLICPSVGSFDEVTSSVAAGAWPVKLGSALSASLAGRDGDVHTQWVGPESTGSTSAMSALEYSARGELRTDPAPEADVRGLSVIATGALAPGAAAVQTGSAAKGALAGLAQTACTPPGTDWWFAGLSEDIGQHAEIVLSNADDGPATVETGLFDGKGAIGTGSTQTVTVPPRGQVTLDLDKLAPDSAVIAAHVHATTGRVSAAARQVASRGENSLGYDWLAPATAAARSIVIPGIVARPGAVRLTVFNPGTDTGNATVEILGANGAVRPAGKDSVTLTPGETTTVDLTGTFDRAASAVRVTADVDVVAGIQEYAAAGSEKDTDLAMLGAGTPVVSTVAVPGPLDVTKGVLLVTSTGKATSVTIEVLDRDGNVQARKRLGVPATSTVTYDIPASARHGSVVVTAAQPGSVVVARALSSVATGGTPRLTVLQPAAPQIESGRSALVRTLR